jgi:hypothetical protein
MQNDTDLLAVMTGAPVREQAKDIPFRDAPNRHEASAGFLSHDRVVSSFSYVYGLRSAEQYISIIRFRLDTAYACITPEDLKAALGEPARLPRAPPSAQRRAREGTLWAAEYRLESGASATFVFNHAPCASSLNVAVNPS